MSAAVAAVGEYVSKASLRSDDFLPRVAPTLALPQAQAESAGDRILLTLLSLGLMLLAFFVVLTALGSIEYVGILRA